MNDYSSAQQFIKSPSYELYALNIIKDIKSKKEDSVGSGRESRDLLSPYRVFIVSHHHIWFDGLEKGRK